MTEKWFPQILVLNDSFSDSSMSGRLGAAEVSNHDDSGHVQYDDSLIRKDGNDQNSCDPEPW